MSGGDTLDRLLPLHPLYQIKNSPFRDKIIPRQDVDLHGVAKVRDEQLIVGKRNETQSNRRKGRLHDKGREKTG